MKNFILRVLQFLILLFLFLPLKTIFNLGTIECTPLVIGHEQIGFKIYNVQMVRKFLFGKVSQSLILVF